jgi:hypothetical protein
VQVHYLSLELVFLFVYFVHIGAHEFLNVDVLVACAKRRAA